MYCTIVEETPHETGFMASCGAALRQYRTKIVRQMRRQIFRQMKQKAE